jgi:methyl-accepting chemotaxis protein
MASTKKKITPQKTAATTTAKKATAKKVAEPKGVEPHVVEPTATAVKTTTRKTASRRSSSVPQEIVHAVVFTVNKQDKELLEAIEQELDASEFSNFDELCKEALYHFLWEDENRSLQHQLNQLEQSIVTKNATAIKQLAQQLRQIIPTIEQVIHPLTAQLDQLQTQVESLQQLSSESQDFASVPRLEIVEVALESAIESSESVAPVVDTIVPDRDPFLDRLSALLEDF